MNSLCRMGSLLAALLLSVNVYAGDLLAEGAWSRATAPGQDAAMVDMSITAKQAAMLVSASSPVCKTVELHSMTHEGGVMKMREVKEITLPAGKRVNLGESGLHLMLLGLKAPLKAGETVPLTLKIRTADKREVKVETSAEVRPLVEARPAQAGHSHHLHH